MRVKLFLCAIVMGSRSMRGDVDLTMSILLEHLKDNSVHYDAQLAGNALTFFGPDVLPYLDGAAAGADRQQRQKIAEIRRFAPRAAKASGWQLIGTAAFRFVWSGAYFRSNQKQ